MGENGSKNKENDRRKERGGKLAKNEWNRERKQVVEVA